ncbi:hypothetical protein T265_06487 [Opisthorchis viverrini]|uniref:EF-hand domain-containing protein n=1 Tax=Opisthorchis viverrini TaxID=6198 RepID=A0A075ADR1_OPIVI|nr:hypothetical protein T265_06487 [Opisthorchis viverrini]KER26204.1 hypothetical protein T265_06487 [Opisthorchis viverrini]
MGNEASLPELCSTFDVEEIKRLAKRFKKLDLDGSGSLSVKEFMSLPELKQNPLVARVIEIFDTDGNGEVDFKEFINGMSQFSVKGDKEAKLRFAFKIYDMDKDGFISNGELFQVLKMMVGNNLKDTQLQQIVDKTIMFADKDGDGRISFEEFCDVVSNLDVHKKMVRDLSLGELSSGCQILVYLIGRLNAHKDHLLFSLFAIVSGLALRVVLPKLLFILISSLHCMRRFFEHEPYKPQYFLLSLLPRFVEAFVRICCIVVIIIDSMISVFNTDFSLLHNYDLSGSLSVKKRMKLDGEET